MIITSKLTAIDSKQGKWKLILVTGVFAFIFMNIFEPFGIYNSTYQTPLEIFIEINIAIIVVIITLSISHFVIKRILKITSFTYGSIIVWFLFESILTGTFWALLSLLFDGINSSIFKLLMGNIVEYVFLIGLPYFFAIFYLNYKEKNKKVDNLLEIINKEKVNPDSMVYFSETSGTEKLGILLKNIIYLESSDNYVTIYYRSNLKNEKFILRNTLKNLEDQLLSYNITRCHRSYLINPTNVISKTKTSKGLELRLNYLPEIAVPVSKSYISEIEKIVK